MHGVEIKSQQGSLSTWLTAAFWCSFKQSTSINSGLHVTILLCSFGYISLGEEETRKATLWEAPSDIKQRVGITFTSSPLIRGVALKCVESIAQASPCWAQLAVIYRPTEAHRAVYKGWRKEQAALSTSLEYGLFPSLWKSDSYHTITLNIK